MGTRKLNKPRRLVDYPRRGKRGLRRWIPSWRQWLGSFALGLALLCGAFAVLYASVDVPDEKAAASREGNVYYWADGTQMVSVGDVNRQNVDLADVPEATRDAVIAAENASFYSDSGVSPKGLGRAVVNMVKGQETQGGSTITQQYVKNTYLSQDQTVTRKVREFVISLKVDRSKSKDEILQGYLNSSWFGRGAYGIEAAAHAYYGIPAKKLDPGQGALLAALLKGAEQYDPAGGADNHERARARWKWILDREVRVGLMSKEERKRYTVFPEPLKKARSTSLGGQTGYLVDIANKYIRQHTDLTDKDLARGGYEIHTTFDKGKVRALERAVRRTLARSVDPEKRPADRHVQVGAASVRPTDGAVVALYGGPDATRHFTNNADTSGVPAGSGFKPFVLAAAMQHGARVKNDAFTGKGGRVRLRVSADSFYDDAGRLRRAAGFPLVSRPGSNVDTALPGAPGSARPDSSHPTLRDALADGGNATYVRLGKDVGWQEVRRTAVDAGLLEGSMARLERTFPIGTSTPSAIRTASAYGTFASGGLRHDPYSVTKVVKDGRPVDGLGRPAARRALDARVAGDVAEALLESGARRLKRAGGGDRSVSPDVLAGGTNDQDRLKSAWFTGSTPRLSTSVVLFRVRAGAPQLLPMAGIGGAHSRHGNAFPVRIWKDYTAAG